MYDVCMMCDGEGRQRLEQQQQKQFALRKHNQGGEGRTHALVRTAVGGRRRGGRAGRTKERDVLLLLLRTAKKQQGPCSQPRTTHHAPSTKHHAPRTTHHAHTHAAHLHCVLLFVLFKNVILYILNTVCYTHLNNRSKFLVEVQFLVEVFC